MFLSNKYETNSRQITKASKKNVTGKYKVEECQN